ncbi:MAG TPA: DEAD/DEAH box helicase family protein [Alcaligenaceae bacterium]|nr:DEAD/DEAH box helicase family protein [Alcaligenaceae bacterium]
MVKAGDKVRKKANPGRIGILGSETSGPASGKRGLVTWLDNQQEEFVLLKTLEVAGQIKEGPYEQILKGRYGRVKDLRGAITAYRLSGRLSNLIYSLETTNTEFYPYQFKPVLQFLESPTNSLLIADEVGLGKTIEAGLIWTELRARADARRLLVVCPAMLRLKWKRELDLRFGVKAEIVDAEQLLNKLEDVQGRPYESFALIASYQGLRPPSEAARKGGRTSHTAKLADFLEEQSLEDSVFDLVVFDEAHYLRNRETKTHALADLLRPVSSGVVMLSATPIQLKSTDLFNLLHLLDEEAFPYESSFEYQVRLNEPLLKLRDKVLSQSLKADEFVLTLSELECSQLHDSEQLNYLLQNPPSDKKLASPRGRSEIADQLDRINPLTKIISRTLKRDVHENRVVREPHLIRAPMCLEEENFYHAVTDEIRRFCSKMDMAEGFLLTTPQRQMASCMPAACKRWRARFEQGQTNILDVEELYELDSEAGPESSLSKSGILLSKLISIVESVGDYETLRKNDSKYAAFLEMIHSYLHSDKNRKIVLFSFFKDTLRYLSERLAEDGVSSVLLHGDLDKDQALAEFADLNGPPILLSSEVASEGVDLQFSSVLINYDLPWNPAKIEQRIGRIDRIGQKEEKILIWNFVYANTVDDRVCDRLLNRLETFERTLGSTEMVLGKEIQQLTHDLLTHSLTVEQEEKRIEQTTIALENNVRQQAQLESEASNLIAHGDFIQNKVQAAKDLGRFVTGEDLFNFVSDYLLSVFQGTRIVEDPKRPNHYKLSLSVDARLQFESFLENTYQQSKTYILSSRAPLLLFENRVGPVPFGVERVTQDHPLIRFIVAHRSQANQPALYADVIATQLKSPSVEIDPDIYVFAVAHWEFSGSRKSERLEYCVKRLSDGLILSPDYAELLVNRAAAVGTDFIAAANLVDGRRTADLQDECRAELEEAFYAHRDAVQREDNDRIRMMVKTLNDNYESKRKRLLERIREADISGDERRIRNIPSLRGRIKKEDELIRQKTNELDFYKNKLQSKDLIVCSGVIKVN